MPFPFGISVGCNSLALYISKIFLFVPGALYDASVLALLLYK